MQKLPKIDTPVHETKLISNKKTIKFRPFLVKEQKIFLMASESDEMSDTINAIKQVLNNCILTEGIDVDDLPIFDLEYLFIQLRIHSVGNISTLQYRCNNKMKTEEGVETPCNAIVDVEIDLQKIKPTLNKKHTNKILLTENLGICFKYPNFSILSSIDSASEIEMLDIIVKCIDYIYDKDEIYYAKDNTLEELTEFIDNLQQEDLNKIKEFFNTMPKIKTEALFHCKKCGYKETMEIEGIQNFFG